MKRSFSLALLILGALVFFSAAVFSELSSDDPVYIRTGSGFQGLYGYGNEYAEFSVAASGVKIQDAYHVLLTPNVGLMIAFINKKELGTDKDLLVAHAQWELNYWHEHASKVESKVRSDLNEKRNDLRITEITVFNGAGAQITSYLVGLRSQEGVFALSISPIDKNIDPIVMKIITSFKLVHKELDAMEIKKRSATVALEK